MPIYEYECTSCSGVFEQLIRTGDNEPMECALCGDVHIRRVLSLFAVSSEHTREANVAAQKKRRDKISRDRAIADWEHEESHRH